MLSVLMSLTVVRQMHGRLPCTMEGYHAPEFV